MKWLLTRTYAGGQGHPDLDSLIFNKKAVLTSVIQPDEFTKVVGFWIFLTKPHRPGTIPVVMLHGHFTGPRAFKKMAAFFEGTRFEPWLCYYSTGLNLRRSAALFRRSLVKAAKQMGVSKLALITNSQGGLVARQALRPYEDGLTLPEIPLVISIVGPWGGTTQSPEFARKQKIAPAGWEDISVGSEFIQYLFTDPLPEKTALHFIYGFGGEPDKKLGEVNDGLLTKASLTRPEAIAEASSVTVFEDGTHFDLVKQDRTFTKIKQILDGHFSGGN